MLKLRPLILSSCHYSLTGEVQSPLRPGNTTGLNLISLVTACGEEMTRHNINQDVELNDKSNEEGPGELGQRPRRLPSGLLDCEVHLVSSRKIDTSTSVSR